MGTERAIRITRSKLDYMTDPYSEITKELEQEELFYEPRPRKKEKETNDNYFQSQVRPYYDLIQRLYGPAFNKIIFVKAMKLFTQRPTMFRETIDWAVNNRLHPLAFSKTVNTILGK